MNNGFAEGKRRLTNAITAGRLSHATLITGDLVLCNRLVTFAASLMFGKTDISELNETVDYLQIDGAKLLTEKAEELLGTIAITPSSNKRIIAISNAGSISQTVQNKLLKIVEEPPPYNYFIFYGNESGLLPTIRSRCALLTLGEIAIGDIVDYLLDIGASGDEAKYFAHLSGGSIAIAERLYTDEEFLRFTYTCAEYFCGLKRNCMVADKLKNMTADAQYGIYVFELCLSDLRRLKLGLPIEHFYQMPISERLKQCVKQLTERDIANIAILLTDAKKALNIKVQPKAVLDNLAARLEEAVH